MELLMLVAGILLLWKFAATINALATAARTKTEVMAERVIGDAVEERSGNFEAFKTKMDGKQTYTHEEIITYFKVGG